MIAGQESLNVAIFLSPPGLGLPQEDFYAGRALSNAAYRPAGLIGSHFNRYSGRTLSARNASPKSCKWSLRTVQTSIKELEALGYLIIGRRELGRRRDGALVCGGRGVANTYAPAVDGSRVAAT